MANRNLDPQTAVREPVTVMIPAALADRIDAIGCAIHGEPSRDDVVLDLLREAVTITESEMGLR